MSNHSARVNLDGIVSDASGHAGKYDWSSMKADYLSNRHLTLIDIAKKYGCSELSVKKHSAAENWVNERAKINAEFVKSTTEASLRKQAKSALQFNEDCLAESVKLLGSLRDEHDRLKAANELKAGDIVKLATGLKTCQEAGRLALGMSTSKQENENLDKGKELNKDDIHAELISLLGEEAFTLLVSKPDDTVQ